MRDFQKAIVSALAIQARKGKKYQLNDYAKFTGLNFPTALQADKRSHRSHKYQ